MVDKRRVQRVLDALDDYYGKEYVCYLTHENDWQLLIATQLSAQCTDERVNQVTPGLFQQFPSLEALANCDIKDLETAIHSTGFYHNKAKNIKACAQKLVKEYQGVLPIDIELLTDLPGVGRKTANVVLGHMFDVPGIVVDTHVKRISKKLGFTVLEDPVKIEYDLMTVIPKEHWLRFNTQIIAHGRGLCSARKPLCDSCFLLKDCPEGLKNRREEILKKG